MNSSNRNKTEEGVVKNEKNTKSKTVTEIKKEFETNPVFEILRKRIQKTNQLTKNEKE